MRTDWLHEDVFLDASGKLPLPKGVEFILRIRSGLEKYDCSTEAGRFDLYVWWTVYGRQDYPSFRWELSESDTAYLFANDGRSLPRAMAMYARERPYLQALVNDAEFGFERYLQWWFSHGQEEPFVAATSDLLLKHLTPYGTGPLTLPPLIASLHRTDVGLSHFDCSTEVGRFGLYVWWTVYGRHGYPFLQWSLSDFDKTYLYGSTDGSMPRVLEFYAQGRSDLQPFLDDAQKGIDRYLLWWFGDGRIEPFVALTAAEFCQGYAASVDRMTPITELPTPLPCIWRLRPDLQGAFDIATQRGRADLLGWWKECGAVEYPRVVLCPEEAGRRQIDSAPQGIAPFELVRDELVGVRGVNVVGFAAGVLGIGEDARMATKVARLAGFDAAALQPNLLWMPKSSPDLAASDALSAEKYPVSLFCLPPTEMIRLVLEGSGALVESPTYKIGAWPWELPKWPESFNGVVHLVDEIWAQSRFVASSFSTLTSLAPVGIHRVPLAVEIPAPTQNVRRQYGLPDGDFLFYVMFDGNSWLTRKNPIAGVRAFQRAFSDNRAGVGLVIKAMNIRSGQPMWEEILRIASKDSRIRIITDTLSRQEVINLMASCDAYVSLHRSEGFGRVIAEAMLLGQPTVATNYSGNVDYCTEETSFLVDGEVKPLRPGDYIFSVGQHWCDPDVDQAAERLREVLEDTRRRSLIAAAGKRIIEDHYSPVAVSRVYRERLASVFEKLGIS